MLTVEAAYSSKLGELIGLIERERILIDDYFTQGLDLAEAKERQTALRNQLLGLKIFLAEKKAEFEASRLAAHETLTASSYAEDLAAVEAALHVPVGGRRKSRRRQKKKKARRRTRKQKKRR